MKQYVVIDLEMCKVERNKTTKEYPWSQETIQIGAALINEEGDIIDTFNTYVRPRFGMVDNFIENLTGITAKDVLKAPDISEALDCFLSWAPGDTEIVSWSDSDLAQIVHEIQGKGIVHINIEEINNRWLDCQKMFSDKVGNERCYSLEEALILADVYQEGRAHDGLQDAINTARLFAKIISDSEFKLNEYYSNARTDEEEHLSFTMGDLFAGLNLNF